MPHYPVIVDREKDEWLVWSTIVDAPISHIQSERATKDHFLGGSWLDYDEEWTQEPRDLSEFEWNRAGENEKVLSIDEIRKQYA